MKNLSIILGAFIFASLSLFSCGHSGGSKKYLALKKQNLAKNEKDIALKEKDILGQDSIKKVNEQAAISSGVYNFVEHSDVHVFWNDFKTAVLSKDIENTKKMCIIPIPSYYFDNKDIMNVDRFFEKEFVNQIKKIKMLKKIKIEEGSSEVSHFNLKINIPVYQLEINEWEYSGAILYFTIIDGKYKLVGIQSWEAEG